MEVKAKAKFIRMSPRKVRLVADLVRGMNFAAAEAQLTFIRKAAARPVLKLIRSAKANAEHNFKLAGDDLFIKSITVDGGPVLHRWTPRAFGRATPIRKRTAHITVVLDEKKAVGAPAEVSKAVVKKSKKVEKNLEVMEVKEDKKAARKIEKKAVATEKEIKSDDEKAAGTSKKASA